MQMQPEASGASAPAHGVMIVDDSQLMQLTLRELVQLLNYEVVGTAGSGEQALRLLASVNPRVIILDYILPHMNGLEFLQRLRQINPETRVIVCSGAITFQTGREFLAAGALELLAKPVQLDMLTKALKRCMTG